MRTLTSFAVLALLFTPIISACSSQPESNSNLTAAQDGDLENLKEYALNESGKDYFSQGIREVLGGRLQAEKFPYYDKRQIKVDAGFFEINRDIVTNGESWLEDPKSTLTVRLENMVRVEGSLNDWTYELAGFSPARGTVHVNVDPLGEVMNTLYSANIHIRFFGKLHYEPQYNEALDESIIDIKASVYDLKSEIKDLHFDTGLVQLVDGVVQDQVNGMLNGAKDNLLSQTNASIADAQSRGELRAKFSEFFSIFPVGG